MIWALPFCLLPQVVRAAPQLLGGLIGSNPQVQLDYGTFQGNTAFQGVDSFLGIPFAKAGRLQNPTVISAADKVSGIQDATQYGTSCPQQELIAPEGATPAVRAILGAIEQLAFGPIENQGENCLSVNVQIPSGLNSTAALPVIFWIHGGGFELGSSAALGSETTAAQGIIYQGAHLVQQSIALGQPIVFVSANHRLNAFGTLASQEITDAGISNLLLKDQRVAMQWIQNYIGNFGGDKTKVTLFGESAGSLAVATHMVLNGGDPDGLFSQAIMASGGIMKLKDYTHGQGTFDFIATQSGCGSASDKVNCLRNVDYNIFYNAVQQVPNFFSYSSTSVPWYPRPDGSFFKDSPHRLLREGQVAKIPYIIGDMKDEGTLFSVFPSINITDDNDFQSFWQSQFFQDLSDAQVKAFTDMYSQNPADGSPYDTGDANEISPQYKRLASSIGDYTFQAGRRDLLNYARAEKSYTYLIEQSLPILGQVPALGSLTDLPVLGSFHVSDVVLNDFGLIPPSVSKNSRNIMSTFIAFVNSGDPNTHGLADLPLWPNWDPSGRSMFQFSESGCSIITDDYREAQMSFLNDNADTYTY